MLLQTTVYDYTPLPDGQHIRVLELHPAQSDTPLSGQLINIELSKKVSVSYVAISYVWGSDKRCSTINIAGSSLAITASAEEVLTKIRSSSEIVTVWIDGICINQDNLAERESQVLFMHLVYAKAAETFIWLGPQKDDSELAIDYIKTFDWNRYNAEHRLNWNNVYTLKKTFLLDIIPDDENGRRLIIACARLLSRGWFSRIWIQQETSFSVHAVVACGQMQVTFDQLAALAWLFKEKWSVFWPEWLHPHILDIATDLILDLQSVRQQHATNRWDIGTWYDKHHEAPRDPYEIQTMQDFKGLAALEEFKEGDYGWRTNPTQHLQDDKIEVSAESDTLVDPVNAIMDLNRHNESKEGVPSRPFWELMCNLSRKARATDPRDKIYAVLNMSISEDFLPLPDYTIDWRELYINLARSMLTPHVRAINRVGRELLLLAGIADHEQKFELPSWVPDWRIHRGYGLPQPDKRFNAGGEQTPRFTIEQIPRKRRLALMRALGLTGRQDVCYQHTTMSLALRTTVYLMDKIVSISQAGLDFSFDHPYPFWARQMLQLDRDTFQLITHAGTQYYVTGQLIEDAYAHLLVAGIDNQGQPADESSILPQLQEWRVWLKNDCNDEMPAYMETMRNSSVFTDYKVSITKKNLMCLVPKITIEGDCVAIIRGVKMPVVLRPVIDGHYLLVGDCYIHGFMRCQASLLIEEYKIKLKPDGTRSWCPQGDVRANGLNCAKNICFGSWTEDETIMNISIEKYKELVYILGEQSVTLV